VIILSGHCCGPVEVEMVCCSAGVVYVCFDLSNLKAAEVQERKKNNTHCHLKPLPVVFDQEIGATAPLTLHNHS